MLESPLSLLKFLFFLFVQKVFEQRLVKIVFLSLPAFHRAGGESGNAIRHPFLELLPDLFADPMNVEYRCTMIDQGKEWFFQFVPVDRPEAKIFQGDRQAIVPRLMKATQDTEASSIPFALPLFEFFGQPFGQGPTRAEEKRKDPQLVSRLSNRSCQKVFHGLGLDPAQQGRSDLGGMEQTDGMEFYAGKETRDMG